MNLNQKFIITLGILVLCIILNLFVDTKGNDNFNSNYSSVQSVVRLQGGGESMSSGNTSVPVPLNVLVALKQTINRREMLRKHFIG